MISINEKTVKSLTTLVGRTGRNCWNLYNPVTKELLTSNSLKQKNDPYFKDRPDSWQQYGVVDLSGVNCDHNLLWLRRVEKYFKQGFYLCTLNKTISDMALCDCKNVGFNVDEAGHVIPFI
jgi:hypothetical protein